MEGTWGFLFWVVCLLLNFLLSYPFWYFNFNRNGNNVLGVIIVVHNYKRGNTLEKLARGQVGLAHVYLTVLIINKMEGDIFNSLKYVWIILMKTTESGLFPVTSRYIFTVLSACFCLMGDKTVICHCSVLPTPIKYTYLYDSWLTQFDSVFYFLSTPHDLWDFMISSARDWTRASLQCKYCVLPLNNQRIPDPHNVLKVDSLCIKTSWLGLGWTSNCFLFFRWDVCICQQFLPSPLQHLNLQLVEFFHYRSPVFKAQNSIQCLAIPEPNKTHLWFRGALRYSHENELSVLIKHERIGSQDLWLDGVCNKPVVLNQC